VSLYISRCGKICNDDVKCGYDSVIKQTGGFKSVKVIERKRISPGKLCDRGRLRNWLTSTIKWSFLKITCYHRAIHWLFNEGLEKYAKQEISNAYWLVHVPYDATGLPETFFTRATSWGWLPGPVHGSTLTRCGYPDGSSIIKRSSILYQGNMNFWNR